MIRRVCLWIFVAGLLLLVKPALAAPSHAEVDPRVWQDLASAPTASLLVRLADPSGSPAYLTPNSISTQSAARDVLQRIQLTTGSQRSLRAWLDAAGISYRSYWIVNLIALQASWAEVEQLASRPDVLYIESDRAFTVPLESPDTSQPEPVGLLSI